MLEPLNIVVNSPGHAFQSRCAQVTADDIHHRSVDVAHGIVVDMWLDRMLLKRGLCGGLDDPPKGGFDPVLDIIVDPVGHEGHYEGRQVELEVQDVAWEGLGDFERVEMRNEIVNEMNVVIVDVLNPRGMDRDKGRHDVNIVIFDVVVNIHHFEGDRLDRD